MTHPEQALPRARHRVHPLPAHEQHTTGKKTHQQRWGELPGFEPAKPIHHKTLFSEAF